MQSHDDDVCAFCLESITSDTITLGCHHSFHRNCILDARDDCCPLCRRLLRSSGSDGLRAQDISLMRKRKREDLEEADRAAAEETLSGHYIGPGTERYRLGMQALLAKFGTAEAICAMDEGPFCKMAHALLHKGVLAGKRVTCRAVREFAMGVHRFLRDSTDPNQTETDATIVTWIAERLPSLPPFVVRSLVATTYGIDDDHADVYIRLAWRSLLVTAL